MQKSQTNILTFLLFDRDRSPHRKHVENRTHGVLTCEAALSQLSTSAAPPDRELPRSLPPPVLTRALSRAHKAHSP